MATNNGRKINWNNADKLARAISNKAFEHLVDPVRKQMEELALSAFRIDFLGQNLPALIAANVVQSSDGSTNIEFRPYSYEIPEDGGIGVSADYGFTTGCWWETIIRNDHVFEKLIPLQQQLQTLKNKRHSLKETIHQQVEGRTVKAVRTAWPEASSILNEMFGEPGGEMTRPLEELLARFLPMLPAPQVETEGV